jgi:membrane protease YdiL (CAAX protease family)
VGHRLSTRTRDWLELCIGYGLILVVVWTPDPWQRILYWIAFAWIAATAWLRRKENAPNGLGLKGLLPSLWIVVAALAVALAAVALAHRLHTLHRLYGVVSVGSHLAGYALWALMQQFILQIYVLVRFLRLGMRRRTAIVISAILFAIAHIPNPVLVPVTLVWGAISCLLFLRYRNLYALALVHAIFGMCIAVTVPNRIHRHMRVGLGYVHYHTHVHFPYPVRAVAP